MDFELTAACDHRCAHGYNVWGAAPEDPGGEPLLAAGALDLVAHACALVPSVTIITNGSHVPASTAKRLGELGVGAVQLTLLAGDRTLHDELKGAVCFDDTLRAAVELVEAKVPVQCCYVAMSRNEGQLERVMQLCHVLGIRAVSYNRMSPTGGAVHYVERLMPSIEAIEADLEVADRVGRAYGIEVGTAMPIPPLLGPTRTVSPRAIWALLHWIVLPQPGGRRSRQCAKL